MKKTVLILFALILSLLCSCGVNMERSEDPLMVYTSENGYAVTYYGGFKPSKLSAAIDFVVMDEETGSTVTILTEEGLGALDMTENEFKEKKLSDGMEIDISSFEKTEINGVPALRAEYRANESRVTEIIYDGGEKSFYATYTDLPGTQEELSRRMTAIINSLEVL